MAWFLRQDNLDRTLPYTSELEKVGFFLAAIGATLAAVSNIAEDGFHIPLTGWVFIASIFSLLIGVLLLAIATLAANVLPRWYGWALLVGLLGLLLNDHLLPEGGGFMLFGLVWLVLGYALLKDQTRMPVPSERIPWLRALERPDEDAGAVREDSPGDTPAHRRGKKIQQATSGRSGAGDHPGTGSWAGVRQDRGLTGVWGRRVLSSRSSVSERGLA